MNNYSKMRRVQRIARKYLEDNGYIVHLTPHTRFQKDIFGLFDMVCVRPYGANVLFVQVKSGYCRNKLAFYNWSKKFVLPVQIMEYLGDGEWRISYANGYGWKQFRWRKNDGEDKRPNTSSASSLGQRIRSRCHSKTGTHGAQNRCKNTRS